MPKILTFSLTAALCGTFVMAQQIGCPASTSSVVGSYGYVATQLPLSGMAMTPPGTNLPTNSNTQIGNLVGDINGGGVFWTSGVLYFDGAGNISVGASSSAVGATTKVGTYSVNSDCTIDVKLSDVFNTTTVTSSGVTTPTMASTNLIGLVLGGGSQIDLSAPESATSTNGNMQLVPGEFASRLMIQLTKSLTYCSVSSLSGAYGLVGTGFAWLNASTSSTSTTSGGTTTTTGGVTTTTGGTTTTSAGTEQPAAFLARLAFDGNGNVTAQTVAAASPLASFQLTGTYTVNLDCSGKMTLSTVPTPATTTIGTGTTTGTATTTSTPATFLVDFVLSPPSGAAALSGYSSHPGIEFTLWNSSETFFGFGTAQ